MADEAKKEDAKMRVVVLKGRTVTHADDKGSKTHAENAEIVLSAGEGNQLIAAGFVRQVGSDDEGHKPAIPKTRDDTK